MISICQIVAPIALDDLNPLSYWLHFSHAQDRSTVTDEHTRTARHAYYGIMNYIYDKVGRITGALNETALDDAAVIIFTGGHGEMLGERGMWYKQTFFEWSARVPLNASGSGIAKG